jgi:hypothetical protein
MWPELLWGSVRASPRVQYMTSMTIPYVTRHLTFLHAFMLDSLSAHSPSKHRIAGTYSGKSTAITLDVTIRAELYGLESVERASERTAQRTVYDEITMIMGL